MSALVLIFTALLGWHKCYAESMSAPYELPPFVVTASRYPQASDQISANTLVLTDREIARTGARNSLEALSLATGFVVRQTGGFGARELISIQGSEHRHVTVLIDGIPMNNLSEGLPDLGAGAARAGWADRDRERACLQCLGIRAWGRRPSVITGVAPA